MAYSFTERKRIRKDFGKLAEKMDLPYLLAIQTDSYSKFLQVGTGAEDRAESGLHAAFKSVFPIVSYSGSAERNMWTTNLVSQSLTSKSVSLAALPMPHHCASKSD